MSEEAAETSTEDKFFGVKTTFNKGQPAEAPEVEVVDDRPEDDRRPPASKEEVKAQDDDELESYGEKVKKRINKLKYQQHEERRKREEAERMREEAIRVAQTYAEQSQQYQRIIEQGEHLIHQQAEGKAKAQLEKAKQDYRQAYEEGNTDRVIAAQEAMMAAQQEAKAANWNAHQAKNRPPAPQRPQPRPAPQVKAPPPPSGRAQSWAAENDWFGKQKDMTALAYGIHERLITEEGVAPDSDEYYETIDRTMRAKFPEYFGEESGSGQAPSSTHQSPPVVTAPSTRNNGAKPRKVRLSRTQIALAKRLGITPEQYANQLLKES